MENVNWQSLLCGSRLFCIYKMLLFLFHSYLLIPSPLPFLCQPSTLYDSLNVFIGRTLPVRCFSSCNWGRSDLQTAHLIHSCSEVNLIESMFFYSKVDLIKAYFELKTDLMIEASLSTWNYCQPVIWRSDFLAILALQLELDLYISTLEEMQNTERINLALLFCCSLEVWRVQHKNGAVRERLYRVRKSVKFSYFINRTDPKLTVLSRDVDQRFTWVQDIQLWCGYMYVCV